MAYRANGESIMILYMWTVHHRTISVKDDVYTSRNVFLSKDEAEADLKEWLIEFAMVQLEVIKHDEEDIEILKEKLTNMNFDMLCWFVYWELDSETEAKVKSVEFDLENVLPYSLHKRVIQTLEMHLNERHKENA